MFNTLTTIVVGVLVFSLLVLVHELGHFLAAKKFGIPVNSFAIGFGPALYKKVYGETEYRINAIPLGGYVSMQGEDEPGVFNDTPVWKRIIVVASGPIFNLVAAVLVFAFVFAIFGTLNFSTQVQSVVAGSAAQNILQPGDELIKIGTRTIENPEDVVKMVNASKGQKIPVEVKRQGQLTKLWITPKKVSPDKYQLGVKLLYLQDFRPPRKNPGQALVLGVQETANMSGEVLTFFKGLFAGHKDVLNNVGGPIMIIQAAGQLARTDMVKLVFFIAALSVNLGLINLLPFPALDGGRLVFMLVELVRGKALDIEKEAIIHAIGFALLIILMIVISANDISRVFQRGL